MNDRYEIQEKIGQGGIGAVYRAYDTQLKREVAIKRMLPDETGNAKSSGEVMLKEATTLSALQHPNIITVYDMGMDDEGGYVVMELLKGETLDQVIHRGVLTLKDFTEVVVQTMEALIAAEAAGVLHRDLKPTNVMVSWLPSRKFQVKILDFSLAKFSRTPAPQTIDQGDAIFGSIYFMAPEQFERGNLDRRTDLYSMGCLYYFCLAGQYPYQGDSAAQVMASHLQGTVIPLEQVRPDLPPVVCQWVMWLINRYANDRPGDAREAFENFQLITGDVEVPTGPVRLPDGKQSAAPLNATSRRLIVPPPGQKTAAVPEFSTAVAGQDNGSLPAPASSALGETSKLTSSIAERQRNNVATYLLIALGVLVVVAALLGVKAFVQKTARDRASGRLVTLANQQSAQQPIKGRASDVPILVGFLDNVDAKGTIARTLLSRLEDESGDSSNINKSIIEALAAARDHGVRAALIDVVRRRQLEKAIPQLVTIASSSGDPLVIKKANEALGVLGDAETAVKMLDNVAKSDAAHLPDGMEAALIVIGLQCEDPSVLTNKVAELVSRKQGNTRHALVRVLGGVGGDRAFDVLSGYLQQETDDARETRLAALAGLKEWPTRSVKVAQLIETGFDSEGVEQERALDAYLKLAAKPGSEPTPEAMFDTMSDYLLVAGDRHLDSFRGKFLNALQSIDRVKAVAIAEDFVNGIYIKDTIKERAKAVMAALSGVTSESN